MKESVTILKLTNGENIIGKVVKSENTIDISLPLKFMIMPRKSWETILVCSACKSRLTLNSQSRHLTCTSCGLIYTINGMRIARMMTPDSLYPTKEKKLNLVQNDDDVSILKKWASLIG